MANLLSLLRLGLAFPFAWLVARGDGPWLAATLFCVAIASDLADGPIARARGTASGIGRALDHFADFAFVDLGLFAAADRGAVPWILPLLVAVAFAQYVIDSYWLHRAGQLRMSALGRWNGVLYFVPLRGARTAWPSRPAGSPSRSPSPAWPRSPTAPCRCAGPRTRRREAAGRAARA